MIKGATGNEGVGIKKVNKEEIENLLKQAHIEGYRLGYAFANNYHVVVNSLLAKHEIDFKKTIEIRKLNKE
jgi:hypothetical protein